MYLGRFQFASVKYTSVTKVTVMRCREDAVRLGLFVGGFTGTYHLISGALRQWQANMSPAHNCMAAGTAAGQAALLNPCTTSIHKLISLLFTVMPSCTACILAEPFNVHCLLAASFLACSPCNALHGVQMLW